MDNRVNDTLFNILPNIKKYKKLQIEPPRQEKLEGLMKKLNAWTSLTKTSSKKAQRLNTGVLAILHK
jgi:hypothetical protein